MGNMKAVVVGARVYEFNSLIVVKRSDYTKLADIFETLGYKWKTGDLANAWSPFTNSNFNRCEIFVNQQVKRIAYGGTKKKSSPINEDEIIKTLKRTLKRTLLELDTFKSFMEWAQYTECNLGNNFRDFYNSDYARDDYEQFVTAWNQGKIGPETTNIYWEEI